MFIRHRIASLLAIGCVVPLAFAASAAPLAPRVVLQANNYVDAAAWTTRDDFIVSISGYQREVTIWDTARRVIVDRIAMPMPADIGNDLIVVDSLAVADDTATIRARRFSVSELLPERFVEWRLDLTARRFTLPPPRPAMGAPPRSKEAYLAPFNRRVAATTQLYEADGAVMTDAQAVAALPPLPKSHDGQWMIERAIDGLVLTRVAGTAPPPPPVVAGQSTVARVRELLASISATADRKLDTDPPLTIGNASLSPDGKTLALVATDTSSATDGGDPETRILMVDALTGRSLTTLVRPGEYGRVQWLDGKRLALFADDTDDGRDTADPTSAVTPAPTLVIDMTTRRDLLSLPPRCFVTATNDGFVGAGLASCRTIGKDRGLYFTDARGRWSKPTVLDKDGYIELIAADPATRRLAIAVSLKDGTLGAMVLDSDSGDTIDIIPMEGGAFAAFAFIDGGKSLLVSANGQLFKRRLGAKLANGDDEPVQQYGTSSLLPMLLVANAGIVSTASVVDSEITRIDLASGKRLAPLDHANVVSGGFLSGGLFWAVSAAGGLRVWDGRTGRVVVTTYFFTGERFFAMTPEGRYDTNLGADAKALRWLMADAPWQSLAPQTFMRDLYEPGLVRKVMECAESRCTPKLGDIPDLANLNRVFPEVRILGVIPGAGDTATVTVQAREGIDPGASNRKTRSGVYDLRLFRDGKLVRQLPDLGIARDEGKSLAQWRAATALVPGTTQQTFTVRVPGGAGAVNFAAYAFNEDRVKGETASFVWKGRPALAVKRRRVVVVAIGVDRTHHPAWRLSYAANDANALSTALAAIPDADVTTIALVSDGKRDDATKRNIRAVLLTLAGAGHDDNMAKLDAARVDLAKLKPVGPDDTVIISFSGHGTTLAKSGFHLIPADAAPDAATGEPTSASMISAVELTAWLRQLDAGEIAMVIDACHSAASVDSEGFKPGPMGDPGLGQLAFDKGIRILAATQANDVALEDGAVGHGLLTFALGEGLPGPADGDRNGIVTLGEWLNYGVARMPGLSAELRAGKLKLAGSGPITARPRGVVWFDDPDARLTRVQQPSLFDFTGTKGALELRRTAKVAAR